jgi:hypothetical protein
MNGMCDQSVLTRPAASPVEEEGRLHVDSEEEDRQHEDL